MERLTEWTDDKKMLAKSKFSGDFGSTNILCRLAEYEDLEEQGLLLRLKCKVGDTIYEIHQLTGKISQRKIKSIVVCNAPDLTIMYKSGYDYSNVQDDFGKTVFLTKDEAEQKLKEMESD